jgi:hypothetical protein
LFGGIKQLKVGGSVQKSAVQVTGRVNVVSILGDLIGLAGLSLGTAELDQISKIGLSGYVAEGNALPAGVFLADIIGSLRVGGSVKAGSVVTTKDLGAFSVLGDFVGGGLFSDGGIKVVKIAGRVTADDASAPATITARGKLKSLVIESDVESARILAGYSKDEVPVNADAQIGKVIVKGSWSGSSLVAGIEDTTADGFGRNDAVITGDSTPSVVSRIARVIIKGAATGTSTAGDHFGITAQEIGSLSINGNQVPLGKGVPDDVLLDEANGDFRVVEIG